jgi:hypothetical protein
VADIEEEVEEPREEGIGTVTFRMPDGLGWVVVVMFEDEGPV